MSGTGCIGGRTGPSDRLCRRRSFRRSRVSGIPTTSRERTVFRHPATVTHPIVAPPTDARPLEQIPPIVTLHPALAPPLPRSLCPLRSWLRHRGNMVRGGSVRNTPIIHILQTQTRLPLTLSVTVH